MRPSLLISALLAAMVGFGGTFAVILAAAEALGATQAQTISWLAGLGIGIAINATLLSYVYKMPITTAWSAPGATLLAGTGMLGYTMGEAVGAFIFCGGLICLTALFGQLRRLVAAIPMPLANALLAGVLFKFIVRIFPELGTNPQLTLPLFALFFLARLFSPIWAVLAVLVLGIPLAMGLGQVGPLPAFEVTRLTLIVPQFNWQAMVSLGIPLYLVTMAGQNLPGLAALRTAGYNPPTRPLLGLTGLTSMVFAFIGSHTQNLSAITATLCTGPDAHPDKDKRWMTGPWLGLVYFIIALGCGWIVAFFEAMPSAYIFTLAAVGLTGPLLNALNQSMADKSLLFPALITFLVAQSSVLFLGLGGEFWGLMLGLALWGLQLAKSRLE